MRAIFYKDNYTFVFRSWSFITLIVLKVCYGEVYNICKNNPENGSNLLVFDYFRYVYKTANSVDKKQNTNKPRTG